VIKTFIRKNKLNNQIVEGTERIFGLPSPQKIPTRKGELV
jgi:hypothetical protein